MGDSSLPGGRTQIARPVRGVYPKSGEPKKQMIFKVLFHQNVLSISIRRGIRYAHNLWYAIVIDSIMRTLHVPYTACQPGCI